jgi:hypothetical protein
MWGLIFYLDDSKFLCWASSLIYGTKLLHCGASSFVFTIQNCCVGGLVFDVYVTKLLYLGPHLLCLRYKIVVLWGLIFHV